MLTIKKSIAVMLSFLLLNITLPALAEPSAGQRMNEIMTEILQAQTNGDTAKVQALTLEMQALVPKVKEEQQAAYQKLQQQAPNAAQNLQDAAKKIQAQQDTPEWKISLAARKGDLAEVKRLRAAGAELNVYRLDPAPPLMEAAMNGRVEVAAFLLEEGAQLRIQKSIVTLDALRFAAEAKEDNSRMLSLLVKHGALKNGDVENIGSVLVKQSEDDGEKSPTVEGKQVTSGSALMAAIEKNRPLHVQTLLSLGANANDWAFGQSALMLAAQKLNLTVVNNLLEQGADASLVGPQNKTALQFAEATRETPQNAEKRRAVIQRIQRAMAAE